MSRFIFVPSLVHCVFTRPLPSTSTLFSYLYLFALLLSMKSLTLPNALQTYVHGLHVNVALEHCLFVNLPFCWLILLKEHNRQ